MREKIEAVMWMFGMTKTEAKRYIKEADVSVIDTIVEAFKHNAKRSFYID